MVLIMNLEINKKKLKQEREDLEYIQGERDSCVICSQQWHMWNRRMIAKEKSVKLFEDRLNQDELAERRDRKEMFDLVTENCRKGMDPVCLQPIPWRSIEPDLTKAINESIDLAIENGHSVEYQLKIIREVLKDAQKV